jgi:hypothetical protein
MKSQTFSPVNEASWMGSLSGWNCTVMKTDDEIPLAPEGSGDGSPSGYNCTIMKTIAEEDPSQPINEAAWQGSPAGWSCAIM